VQLRGKVVTNKIYFCYLFKCLCKTTILDFTWTVSNSRCADLFAGVYMEWPLMKVIITITFCCDNLWKSEFMALEKPGKSENFFLLFCGRPVWMSNATKWC